MAVSLVAVAVGTWLVLAGAASRFAIVGFGGLLVLQSSQELTAGKALYGVVIAASVAVAAFGLWREGYLGLAVGRRFMLVTLILGTVILTSGVVAVFHGTPVSWWIRDIAPYMLLAGAPLLALDLGVHSTQGRIVAILVVLTAAGGLSVAMEWVARRGLWEGAAGGAFASFLLGAAGFAYAVAASSRRNPIAWSVYGAALFALALGTGTRSVLVWLAAPLVVALGSLRPVGSEGGPHPARILVSYLGISIGLVLSGFVLEQAGWPVQDALARALTFDQVAGGTDQSLQARIEQYRVAWAYFSTSPLLGMGPGTIFEWGVPWLGPTGSTVTTGWNMDTPLTLIAKFGVFGLGAFVVALVVLLRTLHQQPGWTSDVNRLAIKAYGVVLVLHLPLGNPLEDKGVALAAVPLLALVLNRTKLVGGSQGGRGTRRGGEVVVRTVTAEGGGHLTSDDSPKGARSARSAAYSGATSPGRPTVG